MGRIDAHQHFWRYHPVKDAWITDDMSVIQRDFLPEDLAPVFQANGITGCVAVQADQSEAETLFLLELAERYPFIEGVVGWVDLQDQDVASRLAHFSRYPKLKGFRHIVQAEADPEFLSRPAFLKGVEALAMHGFTYDVLVKPHQLDAVLAFVARFPGQPFVIDHLAKPYIKAGGQAPWAEQLEAIAQHPHVYCKLSGMVTEADWGAWQPADFQFYTEHAVRVFGADRILFGSDWPVCLVAAEYAQVVGLVEQAIAGLSAEEQQQIWHGNAATFYRL